jgi:hypothetical protein
MLHIIPYCPSVFSMKLPFSRGTIVSVLSGETESRARMVTNVRNSDKPKVYKPKKAKRTEIGNLSIVDRTG